MTTSLTLRSAGFEPVYSWLEQRQDQVEVWGLESGRRAALLAYCDGPEDAFGWSNWTRAAYEDPSEILSLFETLELATEAATAASLNAAFPGLLVTAPVT